MAKGSNFEREICKQLSLWWTDGKRDDIFWRTSASGAMAKVRSKTKQKTFGQYGDVQAIDPIGQPLMDLVTIELKRGYTKSTLSDFVDLPERCKKSCYEKFIEQAITDCQLRDDNSEWILLVKRDYKDVVLFTSLGFYTWLCNLNVKLEVKLFLKHRILGKLRYIFVMNFNLFLKKVSPEIIKAIWRDKFET